MASAERTYEMVVILDPSLGEDDISSAMDRINQLIADRGGAVQDQSTWGRRHLAYPIKRQSEGTYMVSHINLEPGRIADVEASLKLNEQVLRHMIVQVGE